MNFNVKGINIKPFFNKYPFLKNSKVVVALSGGPDSVCLLHLLKDLSKEFNFILSAAHLNHGIRNNEAARDMEFCDKLCKELNIKLYLKELSVPDLLEKGESIETAARRLRYEFFESLDCDYILTAHNLNDNAETVLLNLIRGTGVKGACGIPEKRGKYLRPLLKFKKSEILNYLNSHNLDFVVDSTNKDTDYSRNKIRNLVFPVLNEINEGYLDNINRFSNIISEDQDYFNLEVYKAYQKVEINGKLNLEKLNKYHKAIKSRIIKCYFEKNNLPFNKKTADILLFNIENGIKYFKINTEGNFFVVINNNKLYLEQENNTFFKVETKKVHNLLLKNTIDCDKIVGKLEVSVRKTGDKIKLPHSYTKELRKLYNEKKVPVNLRDSLPVAHDKNGVVWAYKIGTAQRVMPDENSKNIMQFCVRECNENS